MFCHKCGNQIHEGAEFCAKCGNKVTSDHIQSVIPVVQNASQLHSRQAAPGRTFLLVTGILLIISCIYSIVDSFIALVTIDDWLWMYGGEAYRGAWQFDYVLGILIYIYGIIMSVIGIKHRVNIDQGQFLMKLGIGLLAVQFGALFIAILTGYSLDGMSFFELLVFLIDIVLLPALYIVGAVKNKNAYQTQHK